MHEHVIQCQGKVTPLSVRTGVILFQRCEFSPLQLRGTSRVREQFASLGKADIFRRTLPSHAINYSAVFNVASHKRSVGLHWKNPLSGRAKREPAVTADAFE